MRLRTSPTHKKQKETILCIEHRIIFMNTTRLRIDLLVLFHLSVLIIFQSVAFVCNYLIYRKSDTSNTNLNHNPLSIFILHHVRGVA